MLILPGPVLSRAASRPHRLAATAVLACQRLAPFAAAVLPLTFYVRTLAPTVYNLDSAELATAAATLGIPHPPGYPLYVLLAHVFLYLPLGDVGFKANLFSALAAATALGLVFAIVRRLTKSSTAAVGAAWLLGFSYPFWSDSVVAEVYTLDAALVAATFLFLIRWQGSRATSDLAFSLLFFGLSLANRTTNLLALPALLLFTFPGFWPLAPRARIAAALAVLPGLSLYLFLPLRSAMSSAYRWGGSYQADGSVVPPNLAHPSALWDYVSARVFRPLVDPYGWPGTLHQAAAFGSEFWGAFLGAGALLALVGLIWLGRKQPSVALLFVAAALPHTLFFISYGAPDKGTMFLNSYLAAAILAGCGLAALGETAAVAMSRPANAESGSVPRTHHFLVLGLASSIALGLILANLPLVDLSHDRRARDRASEFLDSAEPNAIAIGSWTDLAPVQYLQFVDGRRRDVKPVYDWAVNGSGLAQVAVQNLLAGRAVYALRPEPALVFSFEQHAQGYWYRLGFGAPNAGTLPANPGIEKK